MLPTLTHMEESIKGGWDSRTYWNLIVVEGLMYSHLGTHFCLLSLYFHIVFLSPGCSHFLFCFSFIFFSIWRLLFIFQFGDSMQVYTRIHEDLSEHLKTIQ